MLNKTISFVNFKEVLIRALIKDGCFNSEWFDCQAARVSRLWEIEDNVSDAVDMILIFARAQCPNGQQRLTSATDTRICLSVTHIN